jgi:hypothetical protein
VQIQADPVFGPYEIALVVKALDHYADFLAATNRDGRPYRDIIAKLQQPQQPERKAPVSQMPRVPRKRRAQT